MPLTCFEHDGFDQRPCWAAGQSLSASPLFQGKNRNWSEKSDRPGMRQSATLEACYPGDIPSDRTSEITSCGMTPSGLLPRASVEHGQATLIASDALPAQHMMGG